MAKRGRAMPSAALGQLRQAIASLEPHSGFPPDAEDALLPLGAARWSMRALGGGLACGALHELSAGAPVHLGAAAGFALALAALAPRQGRSRCSGSQTDFGVPRRPARSMAPASISSGFPCERLLVAARGAADRCAVRHGGGAEMPRARRPSWRSCRTRRRRSHRDAAARRSRRATGGALGLLLRHKPRAAPSAAMTRWQVAAAPERARRASAASAAPLSISRSTRTAAARCGRWTS